MPFQLVFGEIMALRGYRFSAKMIDQLSRLRVVHLLNAKNEIDVHLLDAIHLVVKTVIPLGLWLYRCFHADKRDEYTAEEVQSYGRDTDAHLELAATATPQQIGVSERHQTSP